MVELILKQDPISPGIYILHEAGFPGADPSLWRPPVRSHLWRPPTDVYETDEAVMVRVEIAGMNDQDFAIQLDGRSLSIRGMRSDLSERRAYHQMEIRFGEFMTEVELPAAVDAEGIAATYSNGFLRMLLPKVRPMHIRVE